MKIVDFVQAVEKNDEEIKDLVNSGKFKAGVGNGYVTKYEKLIRDGLNSPDSDAIVNKLAFYVYAGALAEKSLEQLANTLNELAIPAFNNQHVAFQNAIVTRDMALKELQLNKDFRIKGGKKRAENDPKHQALKKIKEEFKASNYPFHIRGYKAKFAKEMWEKFPIIESIDSIKNLVTKLCKEIH